MRFIVVAALLASGCMVGDAPREVSADEPLPEDLVAGDVVVKGGIAVVVPDPGETAGISVDQDDGTALELVIENPLGGAVRLAEAPEPPTGISALSASTACGDGAYNLEGFHWASDYHWLFKAASTPSRNSATNVESGLRTAANAITTSRNNCGLADQVSATNSYGGRTTLAPNIPNSSSKVSCGTRDGSNVVGFGTLPASYLGVTCYWTQGNVALEADMRLNLDHKWFALSVPSGCANEFGIEQVGAHEFGHAFGLGHVSQANHPSQTMSPVSYPCTNAKLSLGLGDVRGLRALY